MGSLLSTFESIVSLDTEKDKGPELRSPPVSARGNSQRTLRLLLLGTGLSGKSTFFLQYQVMKNSMGPNRTLYKYLVYRNIVQNVLEVCEGCVTDDKTFPFDLSETSKYYSHISEMFATFNREGRDDYTNKDIQILSKIFEDSKFLKKFWSHKGFRYFDNID